MDQVWYLLILFLVLQPSTPAQTSKGCPKYCSCRGHAMRCKGKYKPFDGIPRAPHDTKTVELSDINLGALTRNMTLNLTFCNLTSLTLTRNNLTTIADDAFQDIHFIEKFSLEEHSISYSFIIVVVHSLGNKLTHLSVKADEDTDVESMNATAFQNLTKLTHLTISLRRLQMFDATALSSLLNLSHLSLSHNSLKRIVIDNILVNVTDLNLQGNNFDVIPDICLPNTTAVVPRLRDLDIGNNAIRRLNVKPIACLRNLRKLTLSENRIEVMQDNAFADLHKLDGLYMKKLPLKKIEELAFNSSSLYKLYFVEMPILSTKRFYPPTLFKYTPNLGTLDMTSTKMDISGYMLQQLLLNLKNIEILNLQGTSIKSLPPGVFSKLTKLRRLVLTGNYISEWRSDVFTGVTSIKSIVLDACNIKVIKEDSFPLEFRLSVKEINFANNPFICTCDLLWFRTWMKEAMANKSIKFVNYPFRYYCRSPNVESFKLEDYNPTVESCTPIPWYAIFLPTFFSLVALLCLAALVAYRYRWYIFYWISLFRRRRQRQHFPLEEMEYDAFVSYSNHDDDWVYGELLAFLEGQLQLRLCDHSRDFEGGKLIVDNVFKALDTSDKTILVISNNYMRSDWCQFELQMALNSFYKLETDLIVVLLEPIQPRHVTSTLRALMTSTTYIEWPDDIAAKNLFRERLKHCLKKQARRI